MPVTEYKKNQALSRINDRLCEWKQNVQGDYSPDKLEVIEQLVIELLQHLLNDTINYSPESSHHAERIRDKIYHELKDKFLSDEEGDIYIANMMKILPKDSFSKEEYNSLMTTAIPKYDMHQHYNFLDKAIVRIANAALGAPANKAR